MLSDRSRPASRLDADGMTQEEVAQALGITRAYVALIERRALRKLSRVLASRGIGPSFVEPVDSFEDRSGRR